MRALFLRAGFLHPGGNVCSLIVFDNNMERCPAPREFFLRLCLSASGCGAGR